MNQVFRTTFNYWAMQAGTGFLISVLAAVLFLWVKIYWLGSLCGLVTIFALRDILRVRQNHVEINEQEIISINNRKEVRIRWIDM
jgi:hypothetical protein